ncbi:ergothioneine biosynthesis glutamate--cysteine ligase EgtA [Pseudofrankia inefficax]|uniref:Glutamate--cysteine ligase EgtA n=1 Tax=Pseudofrankia inefficax (strain DSM 45817 / CECT 9037 / DDB 130130 / EuI1c) TaxID=298654 RepID=E3IYP5_PSEI1|nr:ergothioneine biosynthesis glutamate--cysteine ligase EgtA [Pseudofrankia inefficax]ADP85116.1 glutamate/cysteine ligase family protein [Pseudofrankia inefficax]
MPPRPISAPSAAAANTRPTLTPARSLAAPPDVATRPAAPPRAPAGRPTGPRGPRRRSLAGVTVDDVLRFAAGCLPARPGPRSVGVETEWLVVDRAANDAPVPPERTSAALAPLLATLGSNGSAASGEPAGAVPDATGAVLAGGSRLTFEPGGQLELSGAPLPLSAALDAVRADLAQVRAALADAGLALAGLGLDPLRPPTRWLTDDRYASMAGYWAASGHDAGRIMMCSSASVQINLDAGADPLDIVRRWRLAHRLRPVLVAMFAASPARLGRLTGFGSARTRMWESLDPTRTVQVGPTQVAAADLADRWAEYLLSARLMMIAVAPDTGRDAGGSAGPSSATGPGSRTGPGRQQRLVAVRDGTTFGDWLRGAGPTDRPPLYDDLALHATTIFPPVRPRGWLEIRYLDAQPGDGWLVPVAVTTALLDDPVASAGALAACREADKGWRQASAFGLRDDALRRAAVSCVDLALDGLVRLGADESTRAAVARFRDRYPARGRTPPTTWPTGSPRSAPPACSATSSAEERPTGHGDRHCLSSLPKICAHPGPNPAAGV